jgi:hypothetical protein
MLSLSVDLDVKPLTALLRALPAALDCRREPMRGAMDQASAAVMRGQARRFTSASGGDGTWLDIKPATKAERLRRQKQEHVKSFLKPYWKQHGVTSRKTMAMLTEAATAVTAKMAATAVMPVLFEHGELEAGLFERGAKGHFVEFTKDGVSEGVSGGRHWRAPISIGALALAHHLGVPSKNIPARPVMGPVEQHELQAVAGALSGGVAAAFGAAAATVGGFAPAA